MQIQHLGLIDYHDAWELQKKAQRDLIDGTGEEVIFTCSHPPTITIGRSGSKEHLLVSEKTLEEKNVSLHEIERGGNITYHGPEQAIIYPILNLTNYKRDVAWYLRLLEESVIRFLAAQNITGIRIEGKTGVWVPQKVGAPKKICSMGIRISRWCTLHGLAVNITDCSEGFSLINPCGMPEVEVTSVEQEWDATNSITLHHPTAMLSDILTTLLAGYL